MVAGEEQGAEGGGGAGGSQQSILRKYVSGRREREGEREREGSTSGLYMFILKKILVVFICFAAHLVVGC